ncbi:restriction endonuclease subunit S [Virgibacillus salarius]|uniref:restriction endonuclease subunit S n=1 Tax=Virgibacillus salarius TaxID=447199 RepID=UPI0024938005|nr:restriction endonuclease subunit S [Virgibacillus salarius]WBX80330.1 restriction endonuclease subunit S [Virgibacillus salarius]
MNNSYEYKSTSLPWIKEVPKHWEIEKGKHLFSKMNRPVREKDEIVTAFRDGQVTLRKNRREEGFTNSLKEIGYQGVRKGDLVIHEMDAFAGAIGVSDSDGKCTPVYSVCKPKFDINPVYYSYLLREISRSGYILSLARGIRERSTDFRYKDFGNLYLLVPPREEQNKIVDFLNVKIKLIGEYIEIKDKQVQLAQEKIQMIIHNAVTKGIGNNKKKKDSGIDWLGDIPIGWSVVKNRYLFKEIVDYAGSEEFELLSITRNKGIVKQSETGRNNRSSVDKSGYKVVKKGQMAYNLMNVFMGSIGVSNYTGIISPAYAVFTPIDKAQVNTDYFHYLFRTSLYLSEFTKNAYGIMYERNRLYFERFKNIYSILPPIEEQNLIVNYINEKIEEIESYIRVINKQIEYLKEYKESLISGVIRGKINVTNFSNTRSEINV